MKGGRLGNMMPGQGGAAVNLCLIGQSVLQLETAPHVYTGMWNQSNSIADVNYIPHQTPCQPVPGDEDYEDGLTILYRMGDTLCKSSPRRYPIICGVCTCDKTSQPVSRTPTVDKTEETSEQDGLKLDQLLRVFVLYEKKPANKRSIVVLRNLILSYHGNDTVNPEQLIRLEELLSHQDIGLRGISLLTVQQLCRHNRNVVTFLNHGTLDKLLSMLQCQSSRQLHRHVTDVIEQMVTREDHAGLWLTTMVETGLAAILQRLRTSVDEATTYGCACVLRTLARHAFFIPYIRNNALDDIDSLKNMHGRLRELYMEIFGELLCHRDETDMASVLDTNVFPTLTDILKHGQCHLQKQVLLMLVSLTRSRGCLSVLRAHVLPCVLSLWLDSNCIRVRECAVFALCQLLSARSMSTRLEVVKEIGEFLDTDMERCVYQQLVDGHSQHKKKLLKFDHSLQDFTLSLAASIHREARMEKDREGNITKVHLQPGKHNDSAHINTLCHLVVILGIMTQLQIDHFVAGKRFQKRPESIRGTRSHINKNIVMLQLAHGATCVIDLLHIFTLKLIHSIGWTMLIQTVKEAYRKNTAAKLGVGAGMSAKSRQNRQRHESVDLKGIFELEEVNLILAILGVIHMWVSCSADDVTRCLCLSAKKSMPGSNRCDISIQCTATENESDVERTGTLDIIETADSDVTESDVTDSGYDIKKKTSKLLKSTTETMYEEICEELRDQLGLETNSDYEHKYGHCCFCDDVDKKTSSQESGVDEIGCSDEGLRQVKLLQRDIRVSLFEAGIIESVSPWLACTDSTIKRAVLDILRHMIQPLDDLTGQQSAAPEEKISTPQTDAGANKEQLKENGESKKEPLKGMPTINGEVKGTEMKEGEERKRNNTEDKKDAEECPKGDRHISEPQRDTRGVAVEGSDINEVHIEICDPLKDSIDSPFSHNINDSPANIAVNTDHIQNDGSEGKKTSATVSQDKQAQGICQSRQNYDRNDDAWRALLESKTFVSTDYDQFARKTKERCQSASVIRVHPSSGKSTSSLGRTSIRPSSGKKATSGHHPTGWETCSWSTPDSRPSGRPWSGHKVRRPSSAPKLMRQVQVQHFLRKQNGELMAAFPNQDVGKKDLIPGGNTEKEDVFLKDVIANEEVFLRQRTERKETSTRDNVETNEMLQKQYEGKKEMLLKLIWVENDVYPEDHMEKTEVFAEQTVEQKEVFSKRIVDKKEMFLIQNMEKRGGPKQREEKKETSPRHDKVKKNRSITHIKRDKLPTPAVGKQHLIGNVAQDKKTHETKGHKRCPVSAPKCLGYNKLHAGGRSPRRLSVEKTDSQPGPSVKRQLSPPSVMRHGSSQGWKALFNPSQSPVGQCHTRLVDICGKAMLHELFSKDRSVKIEMLCLLYQLAVHSQVHMLLSEKGVVHKLVDFLRVNDHDEDLQRMGLLLAQELFRHERRLNQLFCKLGGAPLLESMLTQGNMSLRPVVVETLSMLSGEGTPPVVRTRHSSSMLGPDIWDQRSIQSFGCSKRCSLYSLAYPFNRTPSQLLWEVIAERWSMEDKIVQMLKRKSGIDTVPPDVS